MDMKLRGMYIARQLSFHGVTFKIEEVPLSKEFEKVYDESVLLVSLAARVRRRFYQSPTHYSLPSDGWSIKTNLKFTISVGRSYAKIHRSSGTNRR